MRLRLGRSAHAQQPTGFAEIERREPDSSSKPALGLIVGLGNPGAAYAGNRHNLGARTVNLLSRRLGIELGQHSKLASVGEGSHRGERLVLAKPRTYVNESGRAVAELLKRYRLEPEQMLVIVDELDLPIARVRLRPNGGHGGQNGLRSIVGAVGREFARIRIGIGRPVVGDAPSWEPEVVARWVLSDPTPEQRRLLEEGIARAADATICCLDEGIEAAMNRFNRT